VESDKETAQAEVLRAEWTLRESGDREKAARGYTWEWVEGWLRGHCRSPRTLEAYRLHWRHIHHWISVARIAHPSEITYRHGAEYVAFRTGSTSGHKLCGRNTAILESKLLGQVLHEAARRGDIRENPIRSLGIRREPSTRKREFTDDEIAKCLEALEHEEEWMRLTFTIALHTGCRLRETALRMAGVNFETRSITFDAPKGGEGKAFTRPMPEALVPVLWPIRRRAVSHKFPFQPSRCFQNFFGRVGIHGVSIHCLRVSYVTRLHRAGVPLAAAMRLVNHSSTAVHAVYQRLEVEDVRRWADVPLYATTPQTPSDEENSQPEEKQDPSPSSSPPSRKPPGRSRAETD
jgi:integrase